MEAINILTTPLTAEEIEWKVISAKNGSTTLAPYIDARAVMSRLDRAFRPFGWSVRYTPAQVGSEHGTIASIAVKNPETGEWVEKQDGSGASDMEPFKGGISGALKRAATAWGTRRELYSYPRIVIEGEHKYIPFKVLDRLKGLPEAVAEGKSLPEVIRLNTEGEVNMLQKVPAQTLALAPENPHKEARPEALAELAKSIRSAGVLQNLVAYTEEDRLWMMGGGGCWRRGPSGPTTEVLTGSGAPRPLGRWASSSAPAREPPKGGVGTAPGCPPRRRLLARSGRQLGLLASSPQLDRSTSRPTSPTAATPVC